MGNLGTKGNERVVLLVRGPPGSAYKNTKININGPQAPCNIWGFPNAAIFFHKGFPNFPLHVGNTRMNYLLDGTVRWFSSI